MDMSDRIINQKWLLTLICMNTIVLCIVGLPAVMTAPIPHSLSANIFYFISYLAQNILFSVFLGAFLTPIFFYIQSDRLKIGLSLLPVTLLLFMCFMNAKVFSFWRIYIDSSVLQLYVYGGSQVFEMSVEMMIWIWTVGILFFLLSLLLITI